MVGKATAKAHTMQGLVKYHGLRDWELRLPYHNSLSVNIESLWTTTTVEFGDFSEDTLFINNDRVTGRGLERCIAVTNRVRELARIDQRVMIKSFNVLPKGKAKGLGFSSSAGAALAGALFKASGLDKELGWDLKQISILARRLAGSACRSVVGDYAKWNAGKDDETSYAEKVATRGDLDLGIIAVPISSNISTEDAHREAVASAFYQERVRSAQSRVELLIKTIKDGDFKRFGELVELDTMELHAVTMTGPSVLIPYSPLSIAVIKEVRKMRDEGLPANFSMQTGPSVYVNTLPEYMDEVDDRLSRLRVETIRSRIGGEVRLLNSDL